MLHRGMFINFSVVLYWISEKPLRELNKVCTLTTAEPMAKICLVK